jgi:hypothetical protein
MAKKKPHQPKPGRARSHGTVRVVTVEIDPKLDDALEQCMHTERRTKRATITLAIEAYLQERGLWPRSSDKPAS